MKIFTVQYSNLLIGHFVAKDEAVIKTFEIDGGTISESVLNCAYPCEDSLRCDTVDGELIIYNESDRQICVVTFEANQFDDRQEDFYEQAYGYELGNITIHGKDIDRSKLSEELKREITHQAENIIENLNEELHKI
tara:strand:+ start:2453 stop:2860 length:408 start_codon:yes stop_codon:yes gene_type:complete